MDMKHGYRVATAALGCLAMAAAAGAQTREAGIQVEAGLGYSDNITRVDRNEVDETLATAGVAFDKVRDEGRLTWSAIGDVEYVSYLDDTYDDDFYGRADLAAAYAFVPETFSWVAQDSWGQIRRNYLERPTPANQENVNYFSTGPELRLRFGQRTFLDTGARYALATYEETGRDYSSLGGWANFGRQLGEQSDIGLRAAGYWIEYDDPGFGADYDIQEFALNYNAVGARTRLSAQAGYTVLNYRDDTSDGPLFRISVDREVASASRLTLRLGQEYTDPARRFQNGGVAPEGPGSGIPDNTLGVGDPFRNRYADLRWTTAKPRTVFAAGLRYSQEDYQNRTDLDRDTITLYADVLRRITERFEVRAGARLEREEFDNGSFDDDRLRLLAGVSLDLTARTYLTFDWDYFDGDSNSPTRNYTENRVWLRAGYRVR
jgi:hypothetical protein